MSLYGQTPQACYSIRRGYDFSSFPPRLWRPQPASGHMPHPSARPAPPFARPLRIYASDACPIPTPQFSNRHHDLRRSKTHQATHSRRHLHDILPHAQETAKFLISSIGFRRSAQSFKETTRRHRSINLPTSLPSPYSWVFTMCRHQRSEQS